MHKPKPTISEVKGLTRATKQLKFVTESVKSLQSRNNDTSIKSGINLFIFTAVLRINNIRFSDLNISEFNALSDRSSKNYALLIISLFLSGKSARTEVIKSFGLCVPTAKRMLDKMILAGYIEIVPNKTVRSWNGRHFHKDVEHLQLTSKGYDLANHIGTLLVDDRLI